MTVSGRTYHDMHPARIECRGGEKLNREGRAVNSLYPCKVTKDAAGGGGWRARW